MLLILVSFLAAPNLLVSNVSGVAAVPAVAVAVDSDSQPGIAYMLACLPVYWLSSTSVFVYQQ